MRLAFFLAGLIGVAHNGWAQRVAPNPAEDAWALEVRGQAAEAQTRLERAANATPANPQAVRAYAEFLDRYRDPAARPAYARLAQMLEASHAPAAERAAVWRRLAELDLAAGNRAAATAIWPRSQPRAAPGSRWGPAPQPLPIQTSSKFPDPSRASRAWPPWLPIWTPRICCPPWPATWSPTAIRPPVRIEALEQTEYLKLVVRYLSQARELEKLAGDEQDHPHRDLRFHRDRRSAARARLPHARRLRIGSWCSKRSTPRARSSPSIRDFRWPSWSRRCALNRPFTLDYHPARIPLLYDLEYWQSAKDKTRRRVHRLLPVRSFAVPAVSGAVEARPGNRRGVAQADSRAALEALRPRARFLRRHVRDPRRQSRRARRRAIRESLGRTGRRRSGQGRRVLRKAARPRRRLAGQLSSTRWRASTGRCKDYLTDPDRLKRFYTAIRGRVTSPGPARPVFRSNTDMLLLTTRLRLDPDGKPHLPGGLDVWKNLFANHPARQVRRQADARRARLEGCRRRARSPVRPEPQAGRE